MSTVSMRSAPEEAERLYRVDDLVRVFGVTIRQLQWWDEHKVIVPRQVNHARTYTQHEAALVGIIHRLRQCGLSLQEIRKFLPRIERGIAREEGRFLVIILPAIVGFARDRDALVAGLIKTRALSLVVDLLQITDALKERAT